MKLLEHDPVADQVLDIVRHHGEHEGRKLRAKARVAHRRKGSGCLRRSGGLDRFELIHLGGEFGADCSAGL